MEDTATALMSRVLVTGGAGFIGSHLIRKLKKRNLEVGVTIHKSKVGDIDVARYPVDILDRNSLIRAFSDFEPEIIFHLAAQPIVRNTHIHRELDYETILTNMSGTLNVFDAVMQTKSVKKVVHISTDKVFGDIPFVKQDSCLLGTKHPYNASKLAGDVLAQMFASYYSVPTVIVRHGNVYGEGDLHWDRIIPRTIKRIHCGESPIIRGDGKTGRDYIHVDDITDAYLKLMDSQFNKSPYIAHFGSSTWYSTQYVVDELLKLMGRVDLSIQYEEQWKGEIPDQHIESTKLGWYPKVPFNEGLQQTVEWYKKYLEKQND